MEERVIGILGGMGPEATLYLFQKVINNTRAARDQDHLRIVIDNNPKIPDRTPAILGQGETPLPAMIVTAKNLEKAGADFITIPCVSAHYFIGELRSAVSVPIVSIIDEVAAEIQRRLPKIKTIGLIATTGTVDAGLFQERLSKMDVEVLVPPREIQEKLVMSAIYGDSGIKAGCISFENKEKILNSSNEMIERGAEGIIAGCTEVPLVAEQNDIDVPFFDSLDILALAAIRTARDMNL